MVCVWVLVFLLTLAPTVGDCPWRFKSLYSAHGNLNAFHKSVRVRTLMHCVHLCLSISRCQDVHFSRLKCVMFTNHPVESLKRCFGVFSTRKIVWPQQFLLQRRTKTRHLTNSISGTKSRMIDPRKSLKKQVLVAGSADKTTKTFLGTYRSGHAIQPAGETIRKDTSLIPTSNPAGNTPTLKHTGGYINDINVQDRGFTQDIIKPTTGDGQFMHSHQERFFKTKQAKGPMPKGDRANEIPSSGHHGNVNEMSTLKEREPLGNLGSNSYGSSPLRRKTGKENDQVSSNLNRNNHMGTGASQKPTSSYLLKDQAGEDVDQQSSSDLHPTLHTRTEATKKPTSSSLLKDQAGEDVGQQSSSDLHPTLHTRTEASQKPTSSSLLKDVTPSQDRFAVNRKSKQGKAATPAISNNATTRKTNQISTTKPFLDRTTLQQTTTMTARPVQTSTEVACPLWPENKLRPQTTRRMTKDICEQQDGFTFLTNTSMCIKYIEKKYTWLQARRRCWEETGDLVLIDTEEKKAECHDFLLKRGKVPVFNIKRYWIGLQVAPCGIKWVDGSPFLLHWVKKHPTRILCVCAIAEAFRRVIRRNCKTPAETVMCEIV